MSDGKLRETKTERLFLRIDADELERIRKAAQREGESVSEYVRAAIRERMG
jgi:uncharacterized protein (DUF1778 family)